MMKDITPMVVVPLHMVDRAQIDDDRPMDLRELLRIEQLFERRPHHRVGGFVAIAPFAE
jgi:hypothetical protein